MADTVYISKPMEKGSINISDDVVAAIVRPAVLETEGVAELTAAAGAGIAEYIGLTVNSRGIRVRFDNEKICVDVIITVKFGSNIVDVASKAQSAAVTALQNMTGFETVEVNIHVAGIAF